MAMTQNSSTQPKKRALAYVRVSSQRQINGESPETQKAAIEEYAKKNGIEIVDTFYDEAKSGKNIDREELQKLLAYAQKHKGKIDHVIVYKMNRASRDMESYIMGFRVKLKAMGITVRSATEPIDDSVLGQFMELFSVLVGQVDNDTKRGFTLDNMRALAHQGYWQHPPLVGYETHKIPNDIGKLRPTLKPSHMAPKVTEVLERFSQGGITKAELTRYAATIGLRSRYGKKLSEDRIRKLIENPVYAGYVADSFTKGELVEGKHEPLISRDIYELNQTLLHGKQKRDGEIHLKFNPEYPLKGLILCTHCKKPMYASAPKTGAGGRSPRYHCSRSSCKGLAKSVRAAQIHKDFEHMLTHIKPDESLITLYKEVLIAEAANHQGNINGKVSRVRRKLDTIADNRLTAIKNFNTGQLTADEKTALVNSYDEDKAVQLEELRKLEQQQSIQESDIELAVSIMRDVSAQWDVASLSSKVRFQSALFPEGLVYDTENSRFGTTSISPLYRHVSNKKDLPEPEKSSLVAGPGLEPGTSWL